MKNNIRISFLGDIMFEKYSLEKDPEKTNFKKMLTGIKTVFKESDIIVGNIETTFAGKERGYTKEMYVFNTPDKAIEALKEIDLDYAITTNNHILDKGLAGRDRTIQTLERNNIKVIGKNKKTESIEFNGVKIHMLPYTSTTNYSDNKIKISKEDEKNIRLLCNYDYWHSKNPKTVKSALFSVVRKIVGLENTKKLLKLLGKNNKSYKDNIKENKDISEYSERVSNEIKDAKKDSDIVIVIPHMGGQFNMTPGTFSEFYMDLFYESGADLVVGSHPHIIQKAEIRGEVPIFYSIGNVSMAQNSTYIIKDHNPEIGIIVHIDIDVDKKIILNTYVTPILIESRPEIFVSPINSNFKIGDKDIKAWLENRLKLKLSKINKTDYLIN